MVFENDKILVGEGVVEGVEATDTLFSVLMIVEEEAITADVAGMGVESVWKLMKWRKKW